MLTGNHQTTGFCVIYRRFEWRLKTVVILFISELWRGLCRKTQQKRVRTGSGKPACISSNPVSACPETTTEPTGNDG
jgi:hypothetical protein